MHQLVIHRHIAAPVRRVFAAWCEVDMLRRWFAPGDMHVPEARADVRPGGQYRIVMEAPDGARHIVGGEYTAVETDRALEFTWRWESSEITTRVRVEFASSGQGTDMTLTHSEFADTEARDMHEKGWAGCLAKLEPACLQASA